MLPERTVRIVLASPSDVKAERNAVAEVAADLDDSWQTSRGVQVALWRWETDAYPSLHLEGPQGVVDEIMGIAEADIFVGIFWTRFGTRTSKAGSGTEHEFKIAYESWKASGLPRIAFYFKTEEVAHKDAQAARQNARVLAFKERIGREGLTEEFATTDQFRALVRKNLNQLIANVLEAPRAALPAPADDQRAVWARGPSPAETGNPTPAKEVVNYTALRYQGALGTNDETFAIAFATDGSIAAGSSKKVFVWDGMEEGGPGDRRRRTLGATGASRIGGYVYSVAFSRDGRWLAAGGEDGLVRVYDVETESLLWNPKPHGEAVYSVAFSPKDDDDELLASGGWDGMVYLRDAATGEQSGALPIEEVETPEGERGVPAGRIRGHGRVSSVAFSPPEIGKLLAVGDLDNRVIVWDYSRTGDRGRVIGTHLSSVETVAFSPDPGRPLVVSGGLDKIVRAWDLETGLQAWEAPGHAYLVRSVSFAPDGKTIASASWDKTIRFWRAEDGKLLSELPSPELLEKKGREPRWHTDWIWSIAFSDTGLVLGTGGSDSKIVLLAARRAEAVSR